MGCCCCCCPPSYSADFTPQSRQGTRRRGEARFQRPPAAGYTQHTNTSRCDLCGMYVHPTLIDSHREVCRLLQRQESARRQAQHSWEGTPSPSHSQSVHFDADALKKRLPTTDEDAVVDPDDYPMEALCVVCLERLRCYAFLPCGHVMCCRDCAARCDHCPVCREERTGLCFVPPNTVSQYQCKRCGCFIAPAIFDGHREVCALRMRQQAEQKEREQAEATAEGRAESLLITDVTDGEHEAAHTSMEDGGIEAGRAGNEANLRRQRSPSKSHVNSTSPLRSPSRAAHGTDSPAATTAASPQTEVHRQQLPLNLCLECQSSDRHLVITLPCGHRVLCVDCAKKRTSCPVCYQNVGSVLVTYE